MSLNDTGIVPIAPPPGLNFIEAIRPSLTLLLIGATWSSALVPLFFALFLFSTKSLRRTPIFLLNLLGILLGIALGILNYVIEVGAILDPLHPGPTSYLIAFGVLICVVPFLVESILIIRVFAVYPPRTLPKIQVVAIYGTIIAFKIARLINYALFWHTWFPLLGQPGNPVTLSQEAWNRPYQKIEWFLQVFDCGFVSMLFLWRLRAGRKVAGTNHRVRKSKASYYSMINSLFWIAISNFVFPVLLSIAQLVFAFVDSSYLDGAYVLLCNIYVSIIGVLLATIWSAGSKWASSPAGTQVDSGMNLSTFRMAPVSVNVSQFTEVHSGTDASETRVSGAEKWKGSAV